MRFACCVALLIIQCGGLYTCSSLADFLLCLLGRFGSGRLSLCGCGDVAVVVAGVAVAVAVAAAAIAAAAA